MTAKRYLLIDAYNVIYAIEDLRRVLKRSLDSACDRLSERAMLIHDAEGIHTVLVLDSSNKSLEALYPLGETKTFELIYAPAHLSADGVIEQLLTRVAEPEHVTVVSNDGMIRESARVNKANIITAQEFCDWAHSCKKRLEGDTVHRRRAFEKEWRNTIEFDQ